MGGSSPLAISRHSCHLEPGRCCPQGKEAKVHDSTNGPGSSCLKGESPSKKQTRRAARTARHGSCCCGVRSLIPATGRTTAWQARPHSRCRKWCASQADAGPSKKELRRQKAKLV